MDKDKLEHILDEHKKWLKGEGGARANLYWANLSRANLSEANLSKANLFGANLSGATLSGATLFGATLFGATLTGTVLDPAREPNGDCEGFDRDGDYVVGYRPRRAGDASVWEYRDGRLYSAWAFSTCPDTECHPGLYLCPTPEDAREWAVDGGLIRVRTKPSDIHRVGHKWRCRWFEVLGSAERGVMP